MKITILNKYNEEEKINARLLGKGTFATCYESEGTVYSFVKNHDRGYDYTDMSKEAVANFGSENNVHIPRIIHQGSVHNDLVELYTMPLYYKLSTKDSHAWNQAKIIMTIFNSNMGMDNRESAYDYNLRLIELLRGKIDESILEGIESIVSACSAYGDYYKLEFCRQNLKVDSSGNLILLDIIFNIQANRLLAEERRNRFVNRW